MNHTIGMGIKCHHHCQQLLGMGLCHKLLQKLLMAVMHAIKHPDRDNTWPCQGIDRESTELLHRLGLTPLKNFAWMPLCRVVFEYRNELTGATDSHGATMVSAYGINCHASLQARLLTITHRKLQPIGNRGLGRL